MNCGSTQPGGEKFYISTTYYSVVTEELEKAAQQFQLWSAEHPHSAEQGGRICRGGQVGCLPREHCGRNLPECVEFELVRPINRVSIPAGHL